MSDKYVKYSKNKVNICYPATIFVPESVIHFLFKCTSDYSFSWKQTFWTLIRLLLRDQSNLGPYCLQYRLPKKISTWKSRQKLASGNCQKYEINSIRKNKHKCLPTVYPSRQTHTFNLDDRNVNGQTYGQTATTPDHASGYIMLFIGYFTC